MNCPNCGAPEKARVKVCGSCGEAYASQDLLELRQLEYLIEETASWGVPETTRSPYVQRTQGLRDRILRRPPPPAAAAPPVAAAPAPAPAVAGPAQPVPAAAQAVKAPARPAPPKEPVPFDQWLLSERNIKLALYVGGALLVIAGIIFVGVNWTRIPGPGKFAITLLATGLMYLGGFLLFNRPAYRIGGVALLAVASGFLTLNFAVLQLYVMGPAGLRDDVMWLIASPLCLLAYLLTTNWTRSMLFTYLSLIAVGSTLLAALRVMDPPQLVVLFSFSLLLYGLLLLGRLLQTSRHGAYAHQPILLVTQLGQPLLILLGLTTWTQFTGCDTCTDGSPWFSILTLGAGLLFYISTERIFHRIASRWAAAFLLPVVFGVSLLELALSDTFIAIALMSLSLVYMGAGYLVEKREARRAGGWPLYTAAYTVALLVTIMASSEQLDLVWMLLGDTFILAISAAVHSDSRWVYASAWSFILPVYLLLDLYVDPLHNRGLLMGLLGLNYTAIGYVLGKRHLRLGGPFLTAAAGLSIITVGLTWQNPAIASIVLGVIAVLYLLSAFWLDWVWLLLPGLLAINLMALSLNLLLIDQQALYESATISYTVLGAFLVLTTILLQRLGEARWEWPLLLVGVSDLAGAYLAGLASGGALAIGQSTLLAVLSLSFAWLRREAFAKAKLPAMLAYLGILAIFIGHFYVLHEFGIDLEEEWPPYTASLCALFVALAWILRRGGLEWTYASPLRRLGLTLVAIPMAGATAIALWSDWPQLVAATFAVAGLAYAADGAVRRILYLAYLGLGSFLVVIWAVLARLGVTEAQAYVAPAGIALLGIGWNELRQGRKDFYRLATILGLLILLGTSFAQSLPEHGVPYAFLLGIESLVALAWGIYRRTRTYVRLALFTFLLNGVVQLAPGFADLPRWIQLGLTGGVLFGGGLLALFKRDELIQTRTRVSARWREWGE